MLKKSPKRIDLSVLPITKDTYIITPYDTLKCPRIGYDDIANQFFVEYFNNVSDYYGKITVGIDKHCGEYILQLSPMYNNIPKYNGIGMARCIIDFYGNHIINNSLLYENLIEECFTKHTAEEATMYALKLQRCLDKYNYDLLDNNKKIEYNNIKKAIQWLFYWSDLGHGFEAIY